MAELKDRSWIDEIEFLDANNDMGPGGPNGSRDGSFALISKAMENGWDTKRSLFICNGHVGTEYIVNLVEETGMTYKPWIPHGTMRAIWQNNKGKKVVDLGPFGGQRVISPGFMKAGSYEWLEFCIAPRCCPVSLNYGGGDVDYIYFDHFSAYYQVLDLASAQDNLKRMGNPKVYVASTRGDEISGAMRKKFEYQQGVDRIAR